MADTVEFNIEGLEELRGKLREVSEDVQKRGGRFALRKAAQIVRDSARQKALLIDDPDSPENISKNIVERWSNRFYRTTGDLKFRVGVLGGAGGSLPSSALGDLPGGDTRHWRYKEFGTEKVPATPFMRPALSENVEKATAEFVTQYGKAVDRAIKRAKKVS